MENKQPDIGSTQTPSSSLPEVDTKIPETPNVNPGKNPLLLILFGVLLIILSVLSTSLFIQNQKLKKGITPTPDTQPVTTPAATPEITANWKSYSNPRQNYLIRYPQDFVVTENTSPRSDNKKQDIVTIDKDGLTPRIEIDSENQLGLTINSVKSKNISELRLGNLDTFSDEYQDEGGGSFTNYYVIKNNNIFSVTTIYYPQDGDDKEIIKLLNQILSTFKFLN